MKNHAPLRQRRLALLLIIAALAFPATSLAQGVTICDKYPEYCRAVRDAEAATPDKISKNLTAIVDSNTNLIREKYSSCKRVLVTTWVDAGTYKREYQDKVDQPYTFDSCRYTWVTVAPEVSNFCKSLGLKDERLTARLEQLLGLPPEGNKAYFIEFWVNPDDLFRPCPDSEINDQECALNFPRSKYVTVDVDYVTWFFDLRNGSYGASGGYPWTRLGYTYDWGNPASHVGVSEFIIRPGSTVKIKATPSTAEYCSGAWKS